MDEIAFEAGITKPILYRHFRDKTDLYEALATRYTDAVAARLRRSMRGTGPPRELLRSGIDGYIRLVERETAIYRFLMERARLSRVSGEGPVENFMRRLGDQIGLVLGERLREAGLDGAPAEVWGHAIVGLVSASVDWWVDRRDLSRRRLVQYLTDLLWTGMAGSAPAPVEASQAPGGVVRIRRRR
jgi:AcrR family transcriptional regulator